jgi:hypothetical protein
MLGIDSISSQALEEGTFGTWTPEQVAEVAFKAGTVRRPKARYRPGFIAKMLIYLKLWLPYRLWDKMYISLLTSEGEKKLNSI